MPEGWIKLHRSISSHWVYKDSEKFKAWTTILLDVNHEPNKVLIKGTLFKCNRGESLNSLDTWARMFGNGWNKSKVRRFFTLLQNDSMIVLKSESKTTRLTVCNYDNYQGERNADETQMKRKRNADETQTTPNKNDKNVNNEKNDNKYTIPDFEEFKNYALKNEPSINVKELKLKYESWKINGWKNGNNKKIKNWKSTLLNTLPYINKTQNQKPKINDVWNQQRTLDQF